MKKWEYQVVGYSNREPGMQRRKLNELGILGWELVAVREHNGFPIYYFKKPKKEE